MGESVLTLDELSLELPREGDELFRADEHDWEHNACLNPFWPEWELYTKGYKDCADLLVQQG